MTDTLEHTTLPKVELFTESRLTDSERGAGGFGSTGTH